MQRHKEAGTVSPAAPSHVILPPVLVPPPSVLERRGGGSPAPPSLYPGFSQPLMPPSPYGPTSWPTGAADPGVPPGPHMSSGGHKPAGYGTVRSSYMAGPKLALPEYTREGAGPSHAFHGHEVRETESLPCL